MLEIGPKISEILIQLYFILWGNCLFFIDVKRLWTLKE